MGFFGDMFKEAAKEFMNSGRDMLNKKQEYESLPDEELLNYARSGYSYAQRCAAFAVLKDSYGEDQAKRMVGIRN